MAELGRLARIALERKFTFGATIEVDARRGARTLEVMSLGVFDRCSGMEEISQEVCECCRLKLSIMVRALGPVSLVENALRAVSGRAERVGVPPLPLRLEPDELRMRGDCVVG